MDSLLFQTKGQLGKIKPNVNNLRLTSIGLLANLITAGFMTTIGLLTGPISDYFGIELTAATKMFSWSTGGYFVGSIVAFFLLDYMRARTVMLVFGVAMLAATLLNLLNNEILILQLVLGVVGFLCGAGVCIAGTIISRVWERKPRQVALLSQDAIYNVGGVIFPFVTAYILGAGMHWGATYVVAALLCFAVFYLIFKSSFDFEAKSMQTEQGEPKTEWNMSAILAGVFLFLIILAKYTIVIWLPSYAETYLGATTLQSSELIARLFGVALIGSIIGTILIARVNLTVFVASAVLLGFLACMQITNVKDISALMLVVSILGLSLSVLWNGFVAYGVALLRRPSHKHISYIVFCGGVGSTVAPLMSGEFVEAFGMTAVFDLMAAVYGSVFLGLAGYGFLLRMKAVRAGNNTR